VVPAAEETLKPHPLSFMQLQNTSPSTALQQVQVPGAQRYDGPFCDAAKVNTKHHHCQEEGRSLAASPIQASHDHRLGRLRQTTG